MKTLADRIFDLIPRTRCGLSLKDAMAGTRQSQVHVRAAFDALHKAGRGKIVKRGRGGALYLILPSGNVRSCVVCHKEFTPPVGVWRGTVRKRMSTRKTCSRSCHAAYGWLAHPEKREARCKALSAAQSTPEALARTAAHNKRRWSNPEEHEKLREQNSKRWKGNPEKYFEYCARLAIINGTPEKREFYSKLRKENWADPEYAAMVKAKSAASLREQTRRANAGARLKARWGDPVKGERLRQANIAKNNKPENKKRTSERMKKLWQDATYRELMAEVRQRQSTRAKAVATRKERGWWKRDRPGEGAPA
jgi:hypothetical protein